MASPHNHGTITGRLGADPILKGSDNTIVELRIAVDRAGRSKIDPRDTTGWFSVTYFINESPNGKFVRDQIEKGNLSKGSQISLVYRLEQQSWDDQGQKRSKIALIAEDISYSGSRSKKEDSNSTAQTTQVPDEF